MEENLNQEAPQEQPTLVEKKQSYIILLLSIFIVLLVVAVGAYFLYFSKDSVNTETLTPLAPTGVTPPAEEPIIEPVEVLPPLVAVDTSDWKTYTNEEYGFEFEYPNEVGDYLITLKPRIENEGKNIVIPIYSLDDDGPRATPAFMSGASLIVYLTELDKNKEPLSPNLNSNLVYSLIINSISNNISYDRSAKGWVIRDWNTMEDRTLSWDEGITYLSSLVKSEYLTSLGLRPQVNNDGLNLIPYSFSADAGLYGYKVLGDEPSAYIADIGIFDTGIWMDRGDDYAKMRALMNETQAVLNGIASSFRYTK